LIAAIYIRVSTEEQAEKGYSLQEQERVCREKANGLGASEIIVYADEGISGGILERPALTRLREAIRRKQINVLVCRDPDRLARNLTHQLIIADECEKNGVRLEFTGWEWKNTPEGQLFFAIRGAISQYEKEKIRERMRRGKIQKALSGLEPNKAKVYGYTYAPDGQAVVDESEAAIIRQIFSWFTAEDVGIFEIAKRLNNMGVVSPGGVNYWHKQTVKYILRNETYAGRHIYNMRDWSDVKNNKFVKDKAKAAPRPEDEWITVPFPPIVSDKIFAIARDKLIRSRRLWAGKPKRTYLLSGLLRCGDCGNSMTGMLDRYNRRKAQVGYSCKRDTGMTFCLPRKFVRAELIEPVIWEQLISWIYEPERIFRHIEEMQSNPGSLDDQEAALVEQLRQTEKGRKNILDVLATGTTTLDDTTKKILKQLTAREQSIRQQLKAIQSQKFRFSHQEVKSIAVAGKSLLDRLENLAIEDKKAVIRAFISEITVSGRNKEDLSLTIHAAVPEPGALDRIVEKYR
jgi:site-specific DNA recombinase